MNCHGKVRKWENSLGIRIQKSIADQLNLSESTEIDITIQGDRLIVSPCKKPYSLSSLLEEVTPDTLHGETDFGSREGKEAW